MPPKRNPNYIPEEVKGPGKSLGSKGIKKAPKGQKKSKTTEEILMKHQKAIKEMQKLIKSQNELINGQAEIIDSLVKKQDLLQMDIDSVHNYTNAVAEAQNENAQIQEDIGNDVQSIFETLNSMPNFLKENLPKANEEYLRGVRTLITADMGMLDAKICRVEQRLGDKINAAEDKVKKEGVLSLEKLQTVFEVCKSSILRNTNEVMTVGRERIDRQLGRVEQDLRCCKSQLEDFQANLKDQIRKGDNKYFMRQILHEEAGEKFHHMYTQMKKYVVDTTNENVKQYLVAFLKSEEPENTEDALKAEEVIEEPQGMIQRKSSEEILFGGGW